VKALVLALLAVVVTGWCIRKPVGAQRISAEAQAWADWFSYHRDGGGV
jgi:hypothetical protein